MAYVADTSAITTAERTAFASDKSFFLANALRRYNALPQWRLAGSWASGSDVSATGYPARASCDDLIDIPTRPAVQGPAVSEYYLIFDLDDVDIDALAIVGHNFHLLSGTVTVTAQIAQDDSFSTSMIPIATWTPTTAARLVDLDLSSFTRYTGVRYFRIKVASTVAFSTAPSLCEVIAGTRRQLGRRPDRPWDKRAMVSDIPRHRTKAGGSVKYTRHAGGVALKPTWTPTIVQADAITGINDSEVLRGVYEDAGYGARNVLFVDEPTTAPSVAHWCEIDESFSIPETDYDEGQASLALLELSPFALDEVA